jgi:hypothetical protein
MLKKNNLPRPGSRWTTKYASDFFIIVEEVSYDPGFEGWRVTSWMYEEGLLRTAPTRIKTFYRIYKRVR